eukprot:6472303-Amphidinium_carterae.1
MRSRHFVGPLALQIAAAGCGAACFVNWLMQHDLVLSITAVNCSRASQVGARKPSITMVRSSDATKSAQPKTPAKLMDKPSSSSSVKTRKRPDSRITPQEQAATSIYDNLAGHLTNFEIYSLKVNGETCQEKVLRLKKENHQSPGKHVFGKHFWFETRQEYTSSERVENKLVYPPGTRCSDHLQELTSWVYRQPPNRHKLMAYLDRTVALTKTDAIAMMRLLCTENLRRPDPYKLSLAIMRI